MTLPLPADRLPIVSIAGHATLRDAMTAIDRGAIEIALVVGEDGRLAGTLTDGDIRRAILGGALLEDRAAPFMTARFTAVSPETARTDVLDLMRALGVQQVPIVDPGGRLVGLHLLQEILGTVERPNWAVVMAGGRGERLRPVTNALPKPMVRVAGRPILERIVLHLVGFGIRKILLSVNYMGDVIEEHFGDGRAFGCAIEYLREQQPLGTGGALSLVPEKTEHDLVVLNGDLLTQFDASRMLDFHASGRYKATVGVHQYVHIVPYGVVEYSEERITSLREKPAQSWATNAGIYVISPELLGRVPRDTHFPLPALIEDCLQRGEPVGAFAIGDDWIDVGQPKDLSRARGDD